MLQTAYKGCLHVTCKGSLISFYVLSMNSIYAGAPEQAQPLNKSPLCSKLPTSVNYNLICLSVLGHWTFCLNMFQVYTPTTGKQEGQNDITEPILWNIFLIMYLPSSHTPLTLQWSSGSLGCMGGETFSPRIPQPPWLNVHLLKAFWAR